MKINSISIKKFRSLTDRDLEFGPQGNIVYGENYIGKSSVLDAIKFALTGFCRGTDEAGRGKQNLTPDGSLPLIEIDYDHSGKLPDKAVLSAVLEPGRFLDLHPKKQQEIVMSLAGGFPENDFGISALDELTDAHKKAVELRRDIKRQLKEIGSVKPEGDELSRVEIERAEVKLATLRAQRDELLLNIAAAEQSSGVDVDELKKRKRDLEAAIKALSEKAEKDRDQKISKAEKRVKEAEKALKAAEESEIDCRKNLDNVRRVVADLAKTKARLDGILESIDKLSDTCVLGTIPCKIPAKDKARIKKDHKLDLAGIDNKLKEQQKLYNDAEKGLQFLSTEDKKSELRQARAALDLAMSSGESIEVISLKRKLAEIEGELKAFSHQPENPLFDIVNGRTDLAKIETRITKGEGIISGARENLARWELYHEQEKRRETLEKELGDVEADVVALSPDGELARTAQDQATANFPDMVNPLMELFGFSLEVRVSPWEIVARGRDPIVLSDSERIMASAALQYALAKLTGVNVVLVDRLEALDSYHRAALLQIIKQDPDARWIMAFTPPARDYDPKELDYVNWLPLLELAAVGV